VIDLSFFSSLEPSLLWTYREALLFGVLTTLWLTAAAVSGALVIGTLLAILGRSQLKPVAWGVIAYVELWRNTPLLVQLMWVHFALPLVTGVATTPVQSGLLALTLNAAAYFTEIVRAGIEAVPRGQWEASRALGLAPRLIFRLVVLPQALRIMLPPLANMAISVFKGTTIVSILSVGELIQVTNRISNFTFKSVEVFTFAALVYLALGTLFDFGVRRLERRLRAG